MAAKKITKVFISYSQDSPEHQYRVVRFAQQLRLDGFDVVMDVDIMSPREGWPAWMERQIISAKYVLIICTKEYQRRIRNMRNPGFGRGVRWEYLISTSMMYEATSKEAKFIPILLKGGLRTHIPRALQPFTYHACGDSGSDPGYEELLRHLSNQPKYVKRKTGKIRRLPAFDALKKPASANLSGKVVLKRDTHGKKAKQRI